MANTALTVIGWVGTIVVAVAVGRFAALDPRWDMYLGWGAAAGLACALIALAARRQQRLASAEAAGRRSRLDAFIVASVLAAVVLVAVVASRVSLRWDVTSSHVYQIAPETRVAVRRLDAPLRVHVFISRADLPWYRDRLDEYAKASRLVDIDYVDVDAQPALARQYDVQALGTAALEYKGRVELIKAASEQEFTNAVTRLREGRTRKIYFTTGHAERDTASGERVGYSSIAEALQRENFVVEKFNLARDGGFPSDATVAVVAGPRADFFRAEIDSLESYLGRGGALLLLIDPFEDLKRYITESGIALFMMDPSSVSATGELRNLTAFIREQGVELGNDVIVDNSQLGQYLNTDASVPVVANYPPNPITQSITSLSAFPMARSVSGTSAGGRTVTPIIETSAQSWSEKDIAQLASGKLSMDADKGDHQGPVPLGLAVSVRRGAAGGDRAPARETRIVVVGDSDFVANYSANIPGNIDVFLSVIRWLAQERVVPIAPRVVEERQLTMTARELRVVSWLAWLLPALAVGAALYLRSSGGTS